MTSFILNITILSVKSNAYLEFDPDVSVEKSVLLPCDDPWSGVISPFISHNTFRHLGLKKLISTSYAPESKKYKTPYQSSL